MTKVLFITANPNPVEVSFGMAVGESFLKSFLYVALLNYQLYFTS